MRNFLAHSDCDGYFGFFLGLVAFAILAIFDIGHDTPEKSRHTPLYKGLLINGTDLRANRL
jgi:hypothetical protein